MKIPSKSGSSEEFDEIREAQDPAGQNELCKVVQDQADIGDDERDLSENYNGYISQSQDYLSENELKSLKILKDNILCDFVDGPQNKKRNNQNRGI